MFTNGINSPQNIRSDELCSLADQQQAESTGVISPLGHSLRTRAPVKSPAQGEIFYTKELPLTIKLIPNQQINYWLEVSKFGAQLAPCPRGMQ